MWLRGVSKRFGPALVFEAVDLDLAPGTLTLLSGANGAGKSTLLRIIAGASRPSSGIVSDRPRAVGYAPDRLGGSETLTARQYLGLHGRLRRLGSRAIATRAEELSARMYFTRELDTRIDRLSKGNGRKLAILQALLAPTRLLVLDEPYAGLDQRTTAGLNDLLKQETDQGNTVILSDHERRSAVRESRHVELVSGRLHSRAPGPSQPARPTSIVRLATPAGPAGPAGPPLDELSGLAGVLSTEPLDQDQVSVLVERARTDAFLTAALAAGWSVLTVAEGLPR